MCSFGGRNSLFSHHLRPCSWFPEKNAIVLFIWFLEKNAIVLFIWFLEKNAIVLFIWFLEKSGIVLFIWFLEKNAIVLFIWFLEKNAIVLFIWFLEKGAIVLFIWFLEKSTIVLFISQSNCKYAHQWCLSIKCARHAITIWCTFCLIVFFIVKSIFLESSTCKACRKFEENTSINTLISA